MISFSALIITQGREELLMKCLDSLRPNIEDWQLVVVANGQRLSEEMTAFIQKLNSNHLILNTPEIMRPGAARNLGLESCQGEWVFFIDDDAYVLPNYWEQIGPILSDKKIEVVGGPDGPAKGMDAFSRSLAITLSSPFCTGATFSRHCKLGRKMVFANEENLTSCNLWVRRSALHGICFPEDYIRAEETILLQKLSANNVGMFYNPKLAVCHHRRKNLLSLLRPTFYAGYFRSRSMREKLSNDVLAFWLPSLMVVLHAFLFINQTVFWSLAQLYIGIVFTVSLGISVRSKEFWLTPLVAFLHYYIVVMYGVGFICERLSRKPWK